MNNLLIQYMEERMKEKGFIPAGRRHGPVVTISREAGCSANEIARHLLDLISQKNNHTGNPEWKIANKEVVQEAAKELEMPPDKINYVFKSEDRKFIDEVISAFSQRYYKSDVIIRKTIMGVIRHIIEDGYVIMVGRGGVAFARENNNALDIMLQAPLEWRIDIISKKYKISPARARDNIIHTDNERRLLVDHFFGSKTDYSIYDVVFNCAELNIEQISHSIFNLMEMKKMI